MAADGPGPAASPAGPSPSGALPVADLVLQATPLAVRDALHEVRARLTGHIPPEAINTTEIVLAEALNNIVEHAYAEGGGQIRLRIILLPAMLDMWLEDEGRPMPGDGLPPGIDPLSHAEDLPEGGFGWFLIRSLATAIVYRRESNRNRLKLVLPLPCLAEATPEGR